MTVKDAYEQTVKALRNEGLTDKQIIDIIGMLLNEEDGISAIIPCKQSEEKEKDSQNKEKVVEMLRNLGIARNTRGYKYLIEAILLYNEKQIADITIDIYPPVAEKFHTTPAAVERTIRYAIEKCCSSVDEFYIYKFFGNTIVKGKGKPTNSEFISMCADCLNCE